MEAVECIKTRRSVRKFTDRKITQEDIKKIVEIAAYAPSWKNSQTTRYIAVLDETVKNKVAKECVMDFAYNENTILGAPAIVVLTTVENRSGYEKDGSFTTSKGTHWQSFDAGIAAQTFCLGAHSLGFGTVIMGIFDEQKISSLLGVPQGESVSAVIAMGYPAETPEAPKRKDVDVLISYR